MTEFKFYHLVCDIDFVHNQKIIGDYHNSTDEKLETKAIRKYKDAIWDLQGLINNTMAFENNNFEIRGRVTLFGVTYSDNFVIMRHTDLSM